MKIQNFDSYEKKLSLQVLCIAFCIVPIFKLLTSYFPWVLPFHFLPFALACLGCAYIFQIYKNKTFLSLIALMIIYCMVTAFTGETIDGLVIKYMAAAFFSITFIFILSEGLKEPLMWNEFLQSSLKYLRYTSTAVFVACIASFIISEIKNPLFCTLSDWINIFTFSREDWSLRTEMITRTSWGVTIDEGQPHTMMQGPLLLIYPLLHTTLLRLFPEQLQSKVWDKILMVLTILGVFILNSRAMALYLIFVYFYKLARKMNAYLCLVFVPFPLVLTFMGSEFLNGRDVQINFVREKLSLFGHGLASGLHDLERRVISTSYTFDNIHLEAIHNFGVIGYIILLSLFLYFVIYKKMNGLLYITFLIFIFLSLNFNLFDPYFLLPVLLLARQPRLTTEQHT